MNWMAWVVCAVSKRMKWKTWSRTWTSQLHYTADTSTRRLTHALESLGVYAQAHVLHARLAKELVLEQEAGHLSRRHIV